MTPINSRDFHTLISKAYFKAPPRVSYLQPPYAAVHHDTGLRVGKTKTRGPRKKVRSHVSKHK